MTKTNPQVGGHQKHSSLYLKENGSRGLSLHLVIKMIHSWDQDTTTLFVLVPGCTVNYLCSTVRFPWILTQLVWRSRSLWRCDLWKEAQQDQQNTTTHTVFCFSPLPSILLTLHPQSFIVLPCTTICPPLRPYVSTGPVAGPCCLANGRMAVLPSPPLVLWTRWSKGAWEPLQQ